MGQTKILISGASIAGLTLASWLDRYGFAVTIVEKSDAIRTGGYPIDIRGPARRVVERMGILPTVQGAQIVTQKLQFTGSDGRPLVTLHPDDLSGSAPGNDLEVPRGALTRALASTVGDHVNWRFHDSISALTDAGERVHVWFDSGAHQAYDVVLGADGLHSHTRELTFGPEERFHRYLGYCVAGFTMGNFLGAENSAHMWNAPGKSATLRATLRADSLHAFLTFARHRPPLQEHREPRSQRRLITDAFAGASWHVPRMVEEMTRAEDLFFDTVSQIHLPAWSLGRVALAGDAAHAPSFMSGQASSVALVGAYILASELALQSDPSRAFATYERLMRPFAEQNQALAQTGKFVLNPTTRMQLFARNQAIRLVPVLAKLGVAVGGGDKAYTALTLPDYGTLPALRS